VGNQRLAAGLPVRTGAQILVQRGDLRLDPVDHRQRDGDLLACRGGAAVALRATHQR